MVAASGRAVSSFRWPILCESLPFGNFQAVLLIMKQPHVNTGQPDWINPFNTPVIVVPNRTSGQSNLTSEKTALPPRMDGTVVFAMWL